MVSNTLRKTTLGISLLSILPHIFCCGIPAIAAIIALGGTVGLGAALATNPLYNFVDSYHTQLLLLAVAGVVVSGILNLVAYRMDCHNAACTHASCTPKKTKAFRIFFISLLLLALDVLWFATEEYALGLHHHEHDDAHHAEDHHPH